LIQVRPKQSRTTKKPIDTFKPQTIEKHENKPIDTGKPHWVKAQTNAKI